MRKQDCCAGIALHTSCYVLGRLAHNNVEVVMTYHQNHLISEMQNGDREDQEIRINITMIFSPFKDYALGQVLTLNVVRDHDEPSPWVLHARVRRLHTRSLSCTMVVDLLDEEHVLLKDGVAFLKLFDRRFSDSLRSQCPFEPWTRTSSRTTLIG